MLSTTGRSARDRRPSRLRCGLWCLSALLLSGCTSGGKPTIETPEPRIVTFPAGDETIRGFYFPPPSGPGNRPGVIVVHEDYGMNEWVKAQAHELAQQGYAVLAVDLFGGKVFTDLMDAHIMESRLDSKKVVGQLQAAVSFLSVQSGVDPDRLAILGWGSGGGYALETAIAEPRLKTVVVCYGRVPTEAKSLATLQGSVLGVFAGKDLGISPETLAQFANAMKQAGKRLNGPHVYADLPNGFLSYIALPEPTPAQQAAVAEARATIAKHLAEELK